MESEQQVQVKVGYGSGRELVRGALDVVSVQVVRCVNRVL